MKSTSILKKSLVLAAVSALGALSITASAFPIFTVQESAIPGAVAHVFTADNLNGAYAENIVFGPSASPSVPAGQFSATGVFSAGSFNLGSTAVSTQLNGFGAANYGLYAVFTATGTFTPAGTGTNFVGTGGTLQLWADPDQNTTTPTAASCATAAGCVVGGTTVEDILLAFAPTETGSGNSDPSALANGNFELVYSGFTRTATGTAYFILPSPFYVQLDVNGNFTAFTAGAGSSVGVDGAAKAFFLAAAVPEPSTLALLGIALLGAGVSKRQRKEA